MSAALRGTRNRYRSDGGGPGKWLRWSLLVGGALAVYEISRRMRPLSGLSAVGGLFAVRGARAAGRTHQFHAESSFAVNCSPQEAYRYWRKLEHLPLFVLCLEAVRPIDDRRSEWIAVGPMGTPVHWTAEMVDEREPEIIAWRATPDSDLKISGSVEFRHAPGGRGTIVRSTMQYDLPAGPLGKAVAAVFGKDPGLMMREDLRRFKALIEAGEIPTTAGQTHGPRSVLASTLRRASPGGQKPSEGRTYVPVTAERRVS